MKIIKILGLGAVVQNFLQTAAADFPQIVFEVYCRSPQSVVAAADNVVLRQIKPYVPDEGVTYCCCSIDEASFLRQAAPPHTRLQVALPNLQLIKEFIAAGYFEHGCHFILTNPSDLIAEAVIRHTRNPNIFALGLSVDYTRYLHIVTKLGLLQDETGFTLIGNHWDSPLVNFANHDADDHEILLRKLMVSLKQQIKSEFNGFKPPVTSGVQAMRDAVAALCRGTDLAVSGFIPALDVVGGGILRTRDMQFTQPPVNLAAGSLLTAAVSTHKHTYQQLMRNYHENSYQLTTG